MISTRGRYSIRILLDLAEHSNGEFIPMIPKIYRADHAGAENGRAGRQPARHWRRIPVDKRAIRGDVVGYLNSCRRGFGTGVLSAGKCGCM